MANCKRDYDELLKAGNKAQLEKLKMNENKKGFDNLSLQYIQKRLSDELYESSKEVFKDVVDYQASRKEFADIANFSHMGILTCDKMLLKNSKKSI